MGLTLDVAGDSCGSWSYSGFNSFRKKIAEQAGIKLGDMVGFHNVDREFLEENGYTAYIAAIEAENQLPKISWETINDPIKHLLNHSDCDGDLHPSICGELADRLEEITMNWSEKTTLVMTEVWQSHGYPPSMKAIDYDTVQARKLIAGLRRAVELNVPVEFC